MAGEGITLNVGSGSSASDQEVKELNKELGSTEVVDDKANVGGDAHEGGGEGGGDAHEGGDHHEGGDEDDGDGDERTGKHDTELSEANTDEERAAIRERRKKERKDKKDRARDRQQNLERQVSQLVRHNQELAQSVAMLTQNASGIQMARLDEAITEVDQAVNYFQDEIAAATTKGDGASVAKATTNLIAARDRSKELKAYKDAMGRQRPGQNQRSLDPKMVSNARSFMTKHSWYKGPGAGDLDSRVLSQIDNAVHAEGFDPTGPEYWTELETRAKRYLPHRFNGASSSTGDDDQGGGSGDGKSGYNGRVSNGGRRQPVAGNSGDASGPKGGEGYTVSAARVQAIKDAGKWEDPAERKKMIQSYKKYDADHSSR